VGVLIDASVLIAHERGRLDPDRLAERGLAGREEESFYLSVITVSELLHGVHRADSPARRARRAAFVEAVLDQFPVLPIDRPTARVHAELWAGLAAAGTLIGAHDLWIAATAVARDLSLATADLRDFERVPGLALERWGDSASP
jgi:tRNA(fMet)-specific endonuclease VapC